MTEVRVQKTNSRPYHISFIIHIIREWASRD